jgi:hypothetical protein
MRWNIMLGLCALVALVCVLAAGPGMHPGDVRRIAGPGVDATQGAQRGNVDATDALRGQGRPRQGDMRGQDGASARRAPQAMVGTNPAAALSYSPAEGYEVPGAAGPVAAADVTGDGVPEALVVVSDVSGGPCRVVVFRSGRPLQQIADIVLDATCDDLFGGMAVGDLNHDGVADVAVGTEDGIALLVSDGQGGLQAHTVSLGRRIDQLGMLDVDLDGRLDVFGLGWGDPSGSYDPLASTIFYGDGLGGIASSMPMATPQRGYNDLKVADVTADGLPDLVIASGQAPSFWVIAHAPGAGLLAPQAYPRPDPTWTTNAVAVVDLNADGYNEIVVNTSANKPIATLWIYTQRGDGTLRPPTKLTTFEMPGTMLGADLNGNRLQDLAILHDGWDALGSYTQLAGGGLGSERLDDAPVQDHANRQGLAIADLDADGCPDALVGHNQFGLVVLRGENCTPRPPARTGGPLPARLLK